MPDTTSTMLSFQKLDVYRCAIDFLALVSTITSSPPHGAASLADQLKQAATSVPLNIAEAAGRTGPADAARIYGIARGSAMECAAVFDTLFTLQVVAEDKYRRGLELLERIVAMLTKMCR
jgi:four helix bundle protein